ncbi:MAG: hypothetical protein NC253_13425 [Ruminococcus sp.]|nr:hypothetical protein [Ruminococcus sp.]MCM1381374.1 hypothetical protein [Muribaculaceae bacterium]MCM1480286.1 hypothetical protein [Muribaculaceae bacterium]
MEENKSKAFITTAEKAEKTIVTTIINQLENRNIHLDEYSKECAINAVSAINNMLYTAGMSWGDRQLDPSNYQDVIKKVAVQKLNAAASNREVYFQFRNTKIGDNWKKIIEVGIEGDGNDAILRNFGVDVEKVYPYWAVREGDIFEYPTFCGIDVTPPKWTPKGGGRVVRVVYPIKLKSGIIDYRIAERSDVARNLYAHIMNNMMNETFGICADRYKATPEQKAQIDTKKNEIKSKIKDMSLDELLDFPDIQPWISPSWSEPHSREAMILRKMRNNAIKKFPKDFGSAYALDAYNQLADETVGSVAEEIRCNANTGDIIDADFTDAAGDKNADKNTGDGQ